MSELVVTTNDDGTFGLTVDGEAFAPDGEVFVRDSAEEMHADVLIWFGPDAWAEPPPPVDDPGAPPLVVNLVDPQGNPIEPPQVEDPTADPAPAG